MNIPKQSAADEAQSQNQTLVSALTIDGQPVRLSHSGIDTWFNCHRSWYSKYVLGEREDASPESMVGTHIHDALESFYGGKGSERTPTKLRQTVRDSWNDFEGEYIEKFNNSAPLSEAAALDLKIAVWEAIDGIVHLEDPSKVTVLENEMAIDTVYRGLPLRGFIDRVDSNADGTISIIDYKSGKVPQAKYHQNKLLQLFLYGYVLSEAGYKPSKAKLYFTKHKVIIQSDINKKTHIKIKSHMDKAVDEMYEAAETGLFPPKTSPLCGWCPKSADGSCPEGQNFVISMASSGRMRLDAPSIKKIHQAQRAEKEFVPDYEASYSAEFENAIFDEFR